MGTLLKWSPMNAPNSLLSDNPDLESRFDKFQGLRLIIQSKTAKLVCPRNVILGGHEETIHNDRG